jgi:hypothetical protein
MIGGQQAVLGSLGTLKRKIAVKLQHGVAGIDQVRAIDLNFVILLGAG